jgi:hypothetical protein
MSQFMSRAPDLDVHEVPDGYLIYHGTNDSVSYLNTSAAVVFEFCDGKLSAEEIVSRVIKLFGLGESSRDEINGCIESLVKEGLIQSTAT